MLKKVLTSIFVDPHATNQDDDGITKADQVTTKSPDVTKAERKLVDNFKLLLERIVKPMRSFQEAEHFFYQIVHNTYRSAFGENDEMGLLTRSVPADSIDAATDCRLQLKNAQRRNKLIVCISITVRYDLPIIQCIKQLIKRLEKDGLGDHDDIHNCENTTSWFANDQYVKNLRHTAAKLATEALKSTADSSIKYLAEVKVRLVGLDRRSHKQFTASSRKYCVIISSRQHGDESIRLTCVYYDETGERMASDVWPVEEENMNFFMYHTEGNNITDLKDDKYKVHKT